MKCAVARLVVLSFNALPDLVITAADVGEDLYRSLKTFISYIFNDPTITI